MADGSSSGEYGRGALGEASERAGIGLLLRFLGAVFLVLVCGLLLLDRALLRANESQARLDAQSAALLIETFLASRDLLLARIGDRVAMQDASIDSLLTETSDVRRVWVLRGTVAQTIFERMPNASMIAELDQLHPLGANAIDVAPVGGSSHAIVTMFRSLGTRGTGDLIALAFDSDTIRSLLAHAATDSRVALVVKAGDDTVMVIGRPTATSQALTEDTRIVRLASGGTWSIVAMHALTTRSLRWAIWVLGILGALFLAFGLLREQQRAIQATSRSLELERLYRDVKIANQAKSEFLANVSHELRTPLNAIVGFVELLREGFYGDLSSRQTSPVDRIAASATHLRHLVDQVLDIAKIAAGRMEIQAELLDLRAFVLNVSSEVESLLNEKKLTMSVAVGASLPKVRTDPTHLRQILVNLIANAVKFTPAGTITLRARLLDLATAKQELQKRTAAAWISSAHAIAWIPLQVVDTGIGISAGDQDRIFEEFEQVNAGPRGDSMNRGTGLGLPISRRLARLLGGEITVESALGHGATFTVWLPVRAEDLNRATTSQETEVENVSA